MIDILSLACLTAIGFESLVGMMFFPALFELKSRNDAGPRIVSYDNLEMGQPFFLKPAQTIDIGQVLEVRASWNGIAINQFSLANIEIDS